jgi:hypothetical protein
MSDEEMKLTIKSTIILLLRIAGMIICFLIIVYILLSLTGTDLNSPSEIIKNVFK